MRYQDVVTMLTEIEQTLGIPFTYYSYPIGQAPLLPFIVFLYPSSANMTADNTIYQRVDNLTIELYTENKDFALEQSVESILSKYIVWDKTEDYIDSEHMFMITYETEIYINVE